MIQIAALLLAAGKSQRMEGNNKLLMSLDGRSVLARVAGEIAKAPFSEVVAVTGHQTDLVETELRPFGFPFVTNANFANGMHSSIRAGLMALSTKADYFAVCLGDQPFLTTADYTAMIQAARENPQAKLIYPKINGERGNPTLISMSLRDEVLAHADDDKGCSYLFARYRGTEEAVVVDLSHRSSRHAFFDVDTPQAFSQARSFSSEEQV